MTNDRAIYLLGWFRCKTGREDDLEAIDMAIAALKRPTAPKVAYICDGRKCEADCTECFRTLDVAHAKNFKLMGDTYHEEVPSARQNGEWIDWLKNGNEWECSVCKCSVESHGSIAYNFCPMCGADMRGDRHE